MQGELNIAGPNGWAIISSKGDLIYNILECSEDWAWAVFYHNQKSKKPRNTLPSQVPPDFINALKELGYKAVRLVPEKSNTKDVK